VEVADFAEIQNEFMARIQKVVYCSMATVDRQNRPRSRMLHPVWDGPIGWVITKPDSHKAHHLAHNPYVSLAYINSEDIDKPVYVDAIAEWVEAAGEKQRIWQLHQTIPPGLGFDPHPYYGSIENPLYGLLRFTPWRIELGDLKNGPIIWRNT
jgi:general stress protein 26